MNNITKTKILKSKTFKPEFSPYWCVILKDKETKAIQTFTVAYIIYNNQKIDISSIIRNNNNCNFIYGDNICDYLTNQLNNFNEDEFYRSTQQFIIEKDGTEYRGYARVDRWITSGLKQ